ncbi:PseD protein [Campylobacter jejuni]|uniref:motility associated factor glycosyltransferase family protein n=1 Tax=Campylobacter jejuni TaxID=197 RepID=UPI0021AFEA60|nr:motility associated factor glycosyltransferase family protein [Campylobacter jejuni]UWN15190.1 PseD protein [Campylobacter jejuni]
MTFTPTQKELFNKNIEALSNILLKESLKEIKSSKFELILGKDNLDINLKDTSIKNNGGGYNENLLYQDPIKELQTMLNTYNDKYLLYPVLYFYGFGNGVLFKALLQNKNHQHIVVFEKDIEISTGPSLTKQLPLLKKYASKATIFCADSSYPILAKHGIKPDYVCMLERTEITAEFFNHDFGEFDKDIMFICAGVVHPKAIEYLKGRNRKYLIIPRYLYFPIYIKLKYFDFLYNTPSVAHMSYFLSVLLNHKNIIFIGQDLAYAENGNSHPDDYQNSANYESQMYEHILTEAYGGKKEIKTHEFWIFFKQILEAMIIKYHITTYNCTEGGARIEGTIEKPFLWACENLLDKDLNKPFEKLEPLSLNKQNEFLLKAYYKVYQSIKHCRDFSKILSNDFEKIQSIYLSLNEKEEYLNLAIEKIDGFKNKLEDIKQMQDLYEILQPLRTQFELNLARIYVLNPKTKEDAFNKSILWIKEHLEFMELVYGHIKAQENALIKNILPLEEKLKERKLDKWMERVRR